MSRRRKQPRKKNDRVPGRAAQQANTRLERTVRRHGWMIQYVGGPGCALRSCDCSSGEGDGPPFAYTVGLFGMGHPELLVFGLPPQLAAALLNSLGEAIRAGDRLHDGHVIHLDGWGHRIVCEEVPNAGDIVFAANDYYRRQRQHPVPVLQLTYDDGNGVFPWEEGYTGDEQPRPGTFRA